MTIWLHDLADAARSSGLEVIEVPNWRTRSAAPRGGRYGGPGLDAIEGVIIHHTATPETYSTNLDYPTYNVILQGNGSTGGPLSQLGLCRCGRHVYVFAAGICWHAGEVRNYGTQGNRVAIGIEAEHSGNPRDMPWPSARYAGYVTLTAAILNWYRLSTSRAVGHKEASTTGKIDPLFNMNTFRSDVDRARKNPGQPVVDPNDGFSEKHVKSIQTMLNRLGEDLAVDGSLGPATRKAVTAYQEAAGLDQDGLPGPNTTASLEDTMKQLDKIAADVAHIRSETNNVHKRTQGIEKALAEMPEKTVSAWLGRVFYGFNLGWWLRRGSVPVRSNPKFPADPGSPAALELEVASKVLERDIDVYTAEEK